MTTSARRPRLRRRRPGVPGCYHRAIVELMERLGFRYVGVEGADHLSCCTLVFDEGKYATRITIDDVERPKNWRPA